MLSEKVLFALNDTEDSALEAVSCRMGYGGKRINAVSITAAGPARTGGGARGSNRGRTEGRSVRLSRRALLLAAVVTAFLAFGVTAYALNLWGIRELYNNPNRMLPEEAEALIEPRFEEKEADGLRCRITESLCDASQVLLTVEITCGEEYILAPTDAMPEDPLWVIGRTEEGTLGEYAEAQGKKILLVSAYIEGNEDTGISGASIQMESRADNEMVILTRANRDPARATGEAVDALCVVTALEMGGGMTMADVERIEIPFTMTEGPVTLVGTFIPVDPEAVPGQRVGPATVLKTAMGTVISYTETVTDWEAYRNIMKLACDELDQVDYDTVGEERRIEGEGTIENSFTLRFYDWDKQPIGEILFQKAD